MSIRATVENTLAYLFERKTAYQLSFSQPAGQEVLKDLLHFTKFEQSPVGRTTEETYRLIGRQDIIRRIQQQMHLSPEQLFALYNGQPVPIITSAKEDENARSDT